MIIVGIDPHKSTHTGAALDTATGEALGELTIEANTKDILKLGGHYADFQPIVPLAPGPWEGDPIGIPGTAMPSTSEGRDSNSRRISPAGTCPSTR
jgi:hypothetical protein